jgi:hypothetical protein
VGVGVQLGLALPEGLGIGVGVAVGKGVGVGKGVVVGGAVGAKVGVGVGVGVAVPGIGVGVVGTGLTDRPQPIRRNPTRRKTALMRFRTIAKHPCKTIVTGVIVHICDLVGSLHKDLHGRSPCWYCAFKLTDGRRTFPSPKKKVRHSLSSALVNAGISADVRMKLTGHKNLDLHQRYMHV